MKQNVFELAAPTDPIQRTHDFARDLAYGVAQGLWTSRLSVAATRDNSTWFLGTTSHDARKIASELITKKWDNNPPSDSLLLSFNYVSPIIDPKANRTYLLTEKAFSLLNQPATPPIVFISYKRDQSSALALLIEARLKLAGNPNPFVDKNLTPGDSWHGKLEVTIKACEYFISLIGPKTLDSDMVKKEIRWAEEGGCRIISIWHGCKIDASTPDVLKRHHAIQVTGESALEYETTVNQLLNSLGYQTY